MLGILTKTLVQNLDMVHSKDYVNKFIDYVNARMKYDSQHHVSESILTYNFIFVNMIPLDSNSVDDPVRKMYEEVLFRIMLYLGDEHKMSEIRKCLDDDVRDLNPNIFKIWYELLKDYLNVDPAIFPYYECWTFSTYPKTSLYMLYSDFFSKFKTSPLIQSFTRDMDEEQHSRDLRRISHESFIMQDNSTELESTLSGNKRSAEHDFVSNKFLKSK